MPLTLFVAALRCIQLWDVLQAENEPFRDNDRYSYGFELQALHSLAAAPAAATTAAVRAAARAAVAEPVLWVPPAVQLQRPELQQPRFDKERYLWVPEQAVSE